jgi:hypothetical protein
LAERLATMGEIHTGLLHHSVAVSGNVAAQLLDTGVGEGVRRFDRPLPYALSPDQLTGVDCPLPSAGGKVRAIGTAVSRTVLTGGHVLQGSAYLSVAPGVAGRRMPWSHYLARPGVVESLHHTTPAQLATGFLRGAGDGELDLGAIGARAMDSVQDSADLDHRAAFRSTRTRLRWVLDPPGATRPVVRFTVVDATTRTLRLPTLDAPLAEHAAVCEDVALHDWLLTTLLALVERSRIGVESRAAVVDRLRPAVDFLLHLWLPAARVESALAQVWQAVEQRPGFSRQWQVNVDRVRDQLALAALERLGGPA